MLRIGSRALPPGLVTRPPQDWDYIATLDEANEAWGQVPAARRVSFYPINQGKTMLLVKKDEWSPGLMRVEFELAWPGTTAAEILDMAGAGRNDCATLELCLLLKLSHRYLRNSPHFLKTMRDIQKLRLHGVKVPTEWHGLLKRREQETYTYAHPNLDVSKDQFFQAQGALKYVYDHDDIHRAVARSEIGIPAYEFYKEPGAQVKCSRELFEAVPEFRRLNGVIEEAYVLALERSQIPFNYKPDAKWSFDMALQKVCTSITSGWFREYAWEHYDAVQALYDPEYVRRFLRAVHVGRVKRVDGGGASMVPYLS